jgi:hypothetical protein
MRYCLAVFGLILLAPGLGRGKGDPPAAGSAMVIEEERGYSREVGGLRACLVYRGRLHDRTPYFLYTLNKGEKYSWVLKMTEPVWVRFYDADRRPLGPAEGKTIFLPKGFTSGKASTTSVPLFLSPPSKAVYVTAELGASDLITDRIGIPRH